MSQVNRLRRWLFVAALPVFALYTRNPRYAAVLLGGAGSPESQTGRLEVERSRQDAQNGYLNKKPPTGGCFKRLRNA